MAYPIWTAYTLSITWKPYSIIRIFLCNLYNPPDLHLAISSIVLHLNYPGLITYLCQIIWLGSMKIKNMLETYRNLTKKSNRFNWYLSFGREMIESYNGKYIHTVWVSGNALEYFVSDTFDTSSASKDICSALSSGQTLIMETGPAISFSAIRVALISCIWFKISGLCSEFSVTKWLIGRLSLQHKQNEKNLVNIFR